MLRNVDDYIELYRYGEEDDELMIRSIMEGVNGGEIREWGRIPPS